MRCTYATRKESGMEINWQGFFRAKDDLKDHMQLVDSLGVETARRKSIGRVHQPVPTGEESTTHAMEDLPPPNRVKSKQKSKIDSACACHQKTVVVFRQNRGFEQPF